MTVMLDPRVKDQEPEEEEENEENSPAYTLGVLTAFVVALPLITMLLWNWLMPAIFGLPPIGFFKSMGLLALSFIFFKR